MGVGKQMNGEILETLLALNLALLGVSYGPSGIYTGAVVQSSGQRDQETHRRQPSPLGT